MTNPFSAKAAKARAAYNRLAGISAPDAMAEAFPLGGGFSRGGSAKSIDTYIARNGKVATALKKAEYLENCARLFDEGKINARGFTITPGARREASHD